MTSKIGKSETEIKVYKQRWGVLLAVVMLNVSCGILWINYAATATTVANYYEKDPQAVNWFATISFLVAIPMGFIVSYGVDKFGIKKALHIGSSLNLLSAVIRAISTSTLIDNKNAQYSVGLFGQFFSAIANTIFLGISTKVSQLWFPQQERGLSTTFIALARPLGVITAQLSVPHIIINEEDVPLNNYIWLGPAILATALTIIFVTRSAPKTPPSVSAGKDVEQKAPFKEQLRDVFSSKMFFLLALTIGVGIGVIFTLGTLAQQMLCPLGYKESFVGVANGTLLVGGFLGSFAMSFILKRSTKMIEAMKIFFIFALISGIIYFEMFLVESVEGIILVLSIIFGFFAMGTLPVGLELGVETTYPVEQTISTSFIFMAGQTFALILIIISPIMASDKYSMVNSSCGAGITPLDYTVPLMFILSVFTILGCLCVVFFDTPYKRLHADIRKASEKGSIKNGQVSQL